jgi:hypothetical protein
MTEPKRRQDGSIDFDFYRAEAARERKEARAHVVWEVVFPLLWSGPVRLLAEADSLLLSGGRKLADGWSKLRLSRQAPL